MRFRLTKGSMVEVFSHKEASTGAWICAEIVAGNGRTYTVRYGRFLEPVIEEKVPRTAIRPRPPPIIGTDNWVPGDFVEVFHNQSWKTAKVIKITGCGDFYVRLIESSHEFKVHRANLRVRQCWHDGKWFMLGHVEEDMCFTRSLKRGRSCSSCYVEAAKRPRIMENDGSNQKVDGFISSHKKMGENYMHFPMIAKTNGYSHIYDDSYIECPIENDSCSSSVGSCSFNGSEFGDFSRRYNFEDYNSDAESSSGDRHEEEFQSSKLHAYRSVLGALYASGPISWEEQEKMMDLRNALNISDDEHLREIRNLISAKC